MNYKSNYIILLLIVFTSIAVAALFYLSTNKNSIKKETSIRVDTIVVHDTILNGSADVASMCDSINNIKYRIRELTECVRSIDPYEEDSKTLLRDLSDVREKLNGIKKYIGDKNTLGNIYESAYDEGYEDAESNE